MSNEHRTVARFRLRWLLLAFIPAVLLLSLYYGTELQHRRLRTAYDRINTVGFDAHFEINGDCTLKSRNSNLNDSDLAALIPICAGEDKLDTHPIVRLELRGSKVTDAAVARFREAAPACELIR
jgi:hypothetical protein